MSLSLRKSVQSIQQDENELNKLRNAFKISQNRKDNWGYGHIAGFHGVPSWYCWHHQSLSRISVRGPFFLPWHRAYLYWLELHLKQCVNDPSVTIPYWDWRYEVAKSDEGGIPKAYSEEKITGDKNPLFNFHINVPSAQLDTDTSRSPDKLSTLPREKQIENIIYNDDDFDDFLLDLQDVHDAMHGWVGGSMASVGVASYDPIFYAHHCMIDRLWYQWQLIHGPSKGFEQMLDIPLAPFNLIVSDTIYVRHLGYDYAGGSSSVSISTMDMGA